MFTGNYILISLDLHAEMGMFKKPDTNTPCFTFNMLHKPALLGILGAIVGMNGYIKNGEFPEYYTMLKHMSVGICPLNDDKGMFSKCMIKYNNGTGMASKEEGGNLIVTEQILIAPSYRCYLLLNKDNDVEYKLYDFIKSNMAEYIPYFGKNEFSAWWTNVQEYPNASPFAYDRNYKIKSIFAKTDAVSKYVAKSFLRSASSAVPFLYFERLPIGFDEQLKQYEYADFAYSDATFLKEMNMDEAGKFVIVNDNDVIQLF